MYGWINDSNSIYFLEGLSPKKLNINHFAEIFHTIHRISFNVGADMERAIYKYL